jgi:hypothetical protein
MSLYTIISVLENLLCRLACDPRTLLLLGLLCSAMTVHWSTDSGRPIYLLQNRKSLKSTMHEEIS